MQYELAEIASSSLHSPEHELRKWHGYVIKKVGLPKLESVNIYTPEEYDEACAQVNYLNEITTLREFWPAPTDPEVEALIDDPEFEPVQYDAVEVPDMDNSDLVYDTKPGARIGTDEQGNPVFGPDEVKYDEEGKPTVNYRLSTITYKVEQTPRLTDTRSRIDTACEMIARKRMSEVIT